MTRSDDEYAQLEARLAEAERLLGGLTTALQWAIAVDGVPVSVPLVEAERFLNERGLGNDNRYG
jgi:hypothetical protein